MACTQSLQYALGQHRLLELTVSSTGYPELGSLQDLDAHLLLVPGHTEWPYCSHAV